MNITDAYKALADESRLRLINALNHSSFTVQELTQILGIGQSTVSHHLKILTQAGIVKAEKNGTWVYYRLLEKENPTAGALITDHFLHSLKDTLSNGLTPRFEADQKTIDKLLNEKRDAIKNFFDSAASHWKTLREEIQGPESFFNEILKQIRPNETLLELGCGTGSFLDAALPRPGKTIAVDYSEAMLEATRKNLSSKISSVDLRLGYLEHLPVENESVDAALSYMVIHHINDPKLVIKDVSRVLKPGGRFFIVELSKHHREEMRERFADVWLGFEPSALEALLAEAGFTKISIATLGAEEKAFLLTGFKQ